MSATAGADHRRPAAVIVAAAVVVAVLANVAVHAIGGVLGGSFRFTSPSGPATVDPATVAGFTAIPLLIGLTLAALLARRWPHLLTVGLVVAPVLAVATIPVMTLPADFDDVSTVTLAICHVVLVPISLLALVRLRPTGPRAPTLRGERSLHPIAGAPHQG